MNLSASFIFSGYSDYWGGWGDRGRGQGCAFAFYGRNTTLRDLVDQWVEESYNNEHDFEDLPESVSQDDIRDCILESFTGAGRADYDNGAVCEFAAGLDDDRVCRDCGERIGELHDEDCQYWEEDEDYEVVEDDCDDDDDWTESPVAIMLIDWTDHPDYAGKEE